jgi:predicted NUDIX family NTP pyrophosphohydrolase
MPREVSAGLLVYRRKPELAVLLGHPGGPFWANKDERAWTIPKGIVEGDDLLACAQREFAEETGLTVSGICAPLAPVRQKSGKLVHAFALETDLDLAGFKSNEFEMEWPPKSGRCERFPEIDRLEWFAIDQAREKIHAYQLPLLDELISVIPGEAR